MGVLNFFAKISRPWEVHFLKMDGSRESSATQDRPGAMACIMLAITEPGLKIERVTYAGKPVSRTEFEDLVADAHLLSFLLETAQKQGLPLVTAFERIDKAQGKVIFLEVSRRASRTLAIAETHAYDVLMRRLARGLAAIGKQQTP